MKIGIITFVHARNYGAELQAFALQHKLRLIGHQAFVYNLYRPGDKEYIKSDSFKTLYQFNDRAGLKNRINTLIFHFLRLILSIVYYKREKTLSFKFADFNKKYNHLTNRKYRNFEDLYKYDEQFDAYIAGSDQIWNFENGFSVEPYFLTFVNESKLKISYAASIGHSVIPDSIKSLYVKFMSNIDRISMREEQGVELVKQLTNRKVVSVLDPTLLLNKNDWFNVVKSDRMINKPYLLVYMLKHSSYTHELALKIANELNLVVYQICANCFNLSSHKHIRTLYDCGPVEFVNLFYYADFVVTNSFHGTAFSVNFEKNFFATTNKGRRTNSRFISLLGKLNLLDRLLFDGDEFPVKEKWMTENDYMTNLENERAESLAFLTNALKD